MAAVLLGPNRTRVETGNIRSFRVRHHTKRFGVALVTVTKKPFLGQLHECVTCKVTHTVKTLHLPLDDTGACLVSEGVLEEMKMVPDMGGFDFVADIVNPPPITIGRDRVEQEYENNQIRIWKEPVIV